MGASVVWDTRPCSLLKVNRNFRVTFRLQLQGRRIIETRNHLYREREREREKQNQPFEATSCGLQFVVETQNKETAGYSETLLVLPFLETMPPTEPESMKGDYIKNLKRYKNKTQEGCH